METILRGGCLCGAVRYECSGDTEEASYCHCDDCKKATGGPYTVGVLVEAATLRIVCGQVKGYTTIADSGRKITREFCPNCGSPLFTRAEKCPDLVFLKAGCLDEAVKHGQNVLFRGHISTKNYHAFRKVASPR
jgi:hypothetical protein